MAYVAAATWTAKDGEEETVLDAIKKLTPPSRDEPGNRFYQATRDPDDPRVFFLFERYGRGQAIPVLESRERKFYETIDV